MSEKDFRRKIVAEAESWIGTPYVSNGMIKGRRGGTDCAMLLLGVYGNVGLVPKEFDPRPYPPEWHIHQNAEKYLETVLRFAHEVASPPAREPKPGDVVLFKIGRLFAHGGIITDWPKVIHAMGGDRVAHVNIANSTVGKRALANLPQRFFSLWT